MSTNRWLFRFGDFELDAAAYELRRKGRRLRLARQPMDLLLLLVEHPRALVSREEIAKRLWTPDVFIDIDAGIHTAILRIRQALRDSAESPRFVESVPGKGYRFVAAVTRLPIWSGGGYDTTPEPHAPARRDNLPGELTSFVGRRQALADVRKLVAASRLVSLVGTGGVGKTRLAVRLASDLVNQFADGVWLADLTALTAPGSDCTDDRRQRRRSPKRGSIGGRGADPVLPHPRPSPHPGHLRAPARRLRRDCRDAAARCAAAADPGDEPGAAEGAGRDGLSRSVIFPARRLCLVLSAEELMRFEATQLFVERARASFMPFSPAHK